MGIVGAEMTNPLKNVPPKKQRRLLALERKFRASGDWGVWETISLAPGQGGDGLAGQCHQVRRNRVFAVLVRLDATGVVHLAVSSLSGIRPSWPEMQRIKDEIADCPPILVLTGRPDDAWLASWSRAEAAVPHPIDPIRLGDAVVSLLRTPVQ